MKTGLLHLGFLTFHVPKQTAARQIYSISTDSASKNRQLGRCIIDLHKLFLKLFEREIGLILGYRIYGAVLSEPAQSKTKNARKGWKISSHSSE
jgi:hypothetical protein